MDLGLTGKVFLVTAASGGLGRATAEQLVAEGARVFLVARTEDKLASAARELGENARYLAADLSEPATAERVAAAAKEAFGRLDGALVSVGGPPRGSVLGVTDEQWTGAFEGVFLAAIRVARAVVAAADNPVAMASARRPLDDMAPSNGMRPGLGMVLLQLSAELGPQGSRVVGLMPGTVHTDRIDSLISGTPNPEAALAAMGSSSALGRVGRPEEFGKVAAFLLSDAASYVTGTMVGIDGGSIRVL
jgi:3-oxoacyl-[acyl-carrier protein] reductase